MKTKSTFEEGLYIGQKGEGLSEAMKVPESYSWKVPLIATLLTILIFFTGIFIIDLFFF